MRNLKAADVKPADFQGIIVKGLEQTFLRGQFYSGRSLQEFVGHAFRGTDGNAPFDEITQDTLVDMVSVRVGDQNAGEVGRPKANGPEVAERIARAEPAIDEQRLSPVPHDRAVAGT